MRNLLLRSVSLRSVFYIEIQWDSKGPYGAVGSKGPDTSISRTEKGH